MKQLPKRINYDWLLQHHACGTQRANFEVLFQVDQYDPKSGVNVNPRNLMRAARAELLVSWLVLMGWGGPVYDRIDREVAMARGEDASEYRQVTWARILTRDLKSGRLKLAREKKG